jgi:hypothetical protein
LPALSSISQLTGVVYAAGWLKDQLDSGGYGLAGQRRKKSGNPLHRFTAFKAEPCLLQCGSAFRRISVTRRNIGQNW